jgi:hypothetical protein
VNFTFDMSFEDYVRANKVTCTCTTKAVGRDGERVHVSACPVFAWREKWSEEGRKLYTRIRQIEEEKRKMREATAASA